MHMITSNIIMNFEYNYHKIMNYECFNKYSSCPLGRIVNDRPHGIIQSDLNVLELRAWIIIFSELIIT